MKHLLSVLILAVVSGVFLLRCNSHLAVSNTSGEYTSIDSTLSSSDQSLERLINPYSSSLEEKMGEVINTSDHAMTKAKPESLLSNFVADLLFEEVNEIEGLSADFCLVNHGGLRSSLPQGDVTVGAIFQLMPFENEAVIIELEGEKLKEIVTYLINRGGEPVSHFQLSFSDPDGAQVNGEAIDESRTYKIITSDYLAKGGDNMTFFENPVSYGKVGFKIRDLIIEHIREEASAGKPIKSSLDGRLSE